MIRYKECPYCKENIQFKAQKCRYCGEWIDESNNKMDKFWEERESTDSRNVKKGLKEKEIDDAELGCLTSIGLIVAIGVGILISKISDGGAGFLSGLSVFLFIAYFAGTRWRRK